MIRLLSRASKVDVLGSAESGDDGNNDSNDHDDDVKEHQEETNEEEEQRSSGEDESEAMMHATVESAENAEEELHEQQSKPPKSATANTSSSRKSKDSGLVFYRRAQRSTPARILNSNKSSSHTINLNNDYEDAQHHQTENTYVKADMLDLMAKFHMHENGQKIESMGWGTLVFNDSNQNKPVPYLCLSSEDRPAHVREFVVRLMKSKYGDSFLSPGIIVSINGGASDFSLNTELFKALSHGLHELVSRGAAWFLTGGVDSGVMKMLGDIVDELKKKASEPPLIGIASYGAIKDHKNLVVNQPPNVDYLYNPLSDEGIVALNEDHNMFLLVDNGTRGRFGTEIGLRTQLEAELAKHLEARPVVLIIQGGPGTIRTAKQAVEAGILCIVVEGSGRAADCLAYAHNLLHSTEIRHAAYSQPGLKELILEWFPMDADRCEDVRKTIMETVDKPTKLVVYNMKISTSLDELILSSAFPVQQIIKPRKNPRSRSASTASARDRSSNESLLAKELSLFLRYGQTAHLHDLLRFFKEKPAEAPPFDVLLKVLQEGLAVYIERRHPSTLAALEIYSIGLLRLNRASHFEVIRLVLDYGMSSLFSSCLATLNVASFETSKILEHIVGLNHSSKKESLHIFLEHVNSFIKAGTLPEQDANEDKTYKLLGKALQEQATASVVRDFLLSSPLLVANAVVSKEFNASTTRFSSTLIVRPARVISPDRFWCLQALPTSGEEDFPEFIVTPFPYLLESGLVQQIVKSSKHADLMETITVRTVLDYQWNNAKPLFNIQFVLYILFLSFLSGFSIAFQRLLSVHSATDFSFSALASSGTSEANAALALGVISTIIYPCMTIADEALQVLGVGWWEYFTDFWNWLDAAHIALAIAIGPLFAYGRVSTAQFILSLALYLRWFGVLYFLQAFTPTGPLVRMVIQIMHDIRYLLMILVLGIVAAAFAFYALETRASYTSDPRHIYSFLFDMFNMLILNASYDAGDVVGDAVSSSYVLKVIFFVISMLFVPIVLLNLLIALMSDSYENIQDRAFIELYRLQAKIVISQEYGLVPLLNKLLFRPLGSLLGRFSRTRSAASVIKAVRRNFGYDALCNKLDRLKKSGFAGLVLSVGLFWLVVFPVFALVFFPLGIVFFGILHLLSAIFPRQLAHREKRYLHVMVPRGGNIPRPKQPGYQGVLNALKNHTRMIQREQQEELHELRRQLEKARLEQEDKLNAVQQHLSRQLTSIENHMNIQKKRLESINPIATLDVTTAEPSYIPPQGYPEFSDVLRFPLEPKHLPWSASYPDYKPTNFTAEYILRGPVWADPPDPSTILFNHEPWENDPVDRRTCYPSGCYTVDPSTHIPKNPFCRTGMRGRGSLGKWGVNPAADFLITRWRRDKDNKIMTRGGRNILEFVALQRVDSNLWELPGGFVDHPTEMVKQDSRTFVREFLHLSRDGTPESGFRDWRALDSWFSKGQIVSRVYCEDPRSTDNAWIESTWISFHDERGRFSATLILDDDPSAVRWMTARDELDLYEPHMKLLRRFATSQRAAFFN